MELYLDRQENYEKNLDIFLTAKTEDEKKKAWDNIFLDFKTYCFNKIHKMRSFLPTRTIDEWATNVTCNALGYIVKKGKNKRESWPINMGAYLGICCLDINNTKKYNREKIEIPSDYVAETAEIEKGDNLIMVENKTLDEETGKWLITEAVKMTIYNDGYSMLDIDRTMRLLDRYDGKIGKFSKKYTDIKNALEKNIKYILTMDNKENK